MNDSILIIEKVVVDPVWRTHMEKMKEKTISINSLYYAEESLRHLDEIRILRTKEYLGSWLFNQTYPISDVIFKQALDNFVQDRLFGMYGKKDTSSVCSIFAATRLLRKYRSVVPLMGEASLNSNYRFIIEDCWQNGKDGKPIFKDSPQGMETIFTIYNACGAIANIRILTNRLSQVSDKERDMLIFAANRIEEYRTKIEDKKDIPIYALKYQKSDKQSCISALFHSLRSLVFIDLLLEGRLVDDPEKFNLGGEYTRKALEEPYRSGFLNYLRSCYCASGGFKLYNSQSEPDIFQTKYALQALRLLVNEDAVTFSEISWLNFSDIVKFIASCYCLGGFSSMSITGKKPDETIAPNLFSTMTALNCVKLAELYRLNNAFTPDDKYMHYLDMIINNIKVIRRFIDYHHKSDIVYLAKQHDEPELIPYEYYPLPDFKKLKEDRDLLAYLV